MLTEKWISTANNSYYFLLVIIPTPPLLQNIFKHLRKNLACKKTLGRFRKVLQIIKDEDDNDDDNNDDRKMMMMNTLVHLFWKSWYDQKYLRPIIHDFHMLEELCDSDFLSNRSEEFRYKIYQNNISKKFIPISNTLNHLFPEEKSILCIWKIKDFLDVFPVAKSKSFLDLLQSVSFLYSPTFSPLCSLDFIGSVK